MLKVNMGAKKLKKKKLKCKKLLKLQKFSVNKNKSIINNFETQYFSSNSAQDHKLLNCRKNLRFLSEKYISKIKYFLQIRELYFGYLQTVIIDNCKFYNSCVPENVLENLALELEQNAILACLQSDIYEKLMNKIIIDVQNSTEENQIHVEVKKLLPNLPQSFTTNNIKTEKSFLIPQQTETETYSMIPLVSSNRSENCSTNNIEIEPIISNLVASNLDLECINSYQEHNTNHIIELKEPSLIPVDPSTYKNNVIENNINSYENHVIVGQPNINGIVKSIAVRVPPVENETLLEARNQLQKSVEKNLKEVEKVNKQRKDEKQRAYIAQILEGDDSADENFYDSLSDSENDFKENVNETNLVDRLQKMRELFGLDEEEKPILTITNKLKTKPQKPKTRHSTMWKYEKIIQHYKLSLLSSETSFEKRSKNKMLFLKFFGEDSDEEHELEYLSEEKYRGSCTERISSWVVKYLMPYYHNKRIVGRNVFKSLGHYVSKTIVDKIQYPDEWTVKYFVSKFFPPKKKYLSEADVFALEIEEL